MPGRRRRFHRPLNRAVWFDGDSLTFGVGSSGGQTYPAQTLALLPAPLDSTNYGISGQTIAQMLAGAPVKVDGLYDLRRPRQVVVYWGGTNDLYNGVAQATVYSHIVAYGQARRAAGYKVVVLTMLPRNQAGEPASFETDRQTINSSIRANLASFADALADVGNDANIGQAGDENNTTYYGGDGIHLNNTGYGIVAGLVNTAVRSLL